MLKKKQTSYPFVNGLNEPNELNGLAHLCIAVLPEPLHATCTPHAAGTGNMCPSYKLGFQDGDAKRMGVGDSVADPHSFFAYPDPSKKLNVDPEP